jgi:hypothetical protein
MTMALSFAGAIVRADDVPPYCAELRQVAAAALAKDKFVGIIGTPRTGNYLEATVALPGGTTARSTERAPTPAILTVSKLQRKAIAHLRRSWAKSKLVFATAGPRIKTAHPRGMPCCTTTGRRLRSPSTQIGRRTANISYA